MIDEGGEGEGLFPEQVNHIFKIIDPFLTELLMAEPLELRLTSFAFNALPKRSPRTPHCVLRLAPPYRGKYLPNGYGNWVD